MHYADALASMTRDLTDSLWGTVRATPEDKLTWRPASDARTMVEILEELVTVTKSSADMIRTKVVPRGMEEESAPLKMSIAEMEKAHRANVEDYLAAVKTFPDGALQDSLNLPWGPMTMLQVISYPYWNLAYHWGQISYIQMMYGDKAMY